MLPAPGPSWVCNLVSLVFSRFLQFGVESSTKTRENHKDIKTRLHTPYSPTRPPFPRPVGSAILRFFWFLEGVTLWGRKQRTFRTPNKQKTRFALTHLVLPPPRLLVGLQSFFLKVVCIFWNNSSFPEDFGETMF